MQSDRAHLTTADYRKIQVSPDIDMICYLRLIASHKVESLSSN